MLSTDQYMLSSGIEEPAIGDGLKWSGAECTIFSSGH